MALSTNPDIERWNRKYRDRKVEPDWSPEPELTQCDALGGRGGLALDLACGIGKNALHLARNGYRVCAVDAALEGLRRCLCVAREQDLEVYPVCIDLTRYPLPESTFDLIAVVRFLDRSLFPDIQSALKPGGLLFYKTFNRNFLQKHPDFNPAYLLQPGELECAFPELHILKSNSGEETTNSSILARKERNPM